MSTSGIYHIINLLNNKRYIGSSSNIQARFVTHRRQLDAGKHVNKHLQAAWVKYGTAAFDFCILEAVKPSLAATLEQVYLDKYKDNWDALYNIQRLAVQVSGYTHRTANQKGVNNNYYRSKKADGKQDFLYMVTTPEGDELFSRTLKTLCTSLQLNQGCMSKVARGLTNSHKGYQVVKVYT
jgi:group I intron endonuclease